MRYRIEINLGEENSEMKVFHEYDNSVQRFGGKNKDILKEIETIARGYDEPVFTVYEPQTPAACHFGGRVESKLIAAGVRYGWKREDRV